MNIDGFALPIKKLKGTEPVETLDFSSKGLGPASAIVISSLISANASLTMRKRTALALELWPTQIRRLVTCVFL